MGALAIFAAQILRLTYSTSSRLAPPPLQRNRSSVTEFMKPRKTNER
jgi:hypothetical protein